jgi:hypothetical protein
MMRKLSLTALMFTMAIAMVPCSSLRAAPPQAEKAQAGPLQIYSVHYNIYELANGKRINSRSYQVMVAEPHRIGGNGVGSIRVGNQVPIILGSSQTAGGTKMPQSIEYRNVGMDIDCSLLDAPAPAGNVLLSTRIKWESISGKDLASGNPVLRSLIFSGPALIPLGKPTTIGTVDDVTGDHQYEIEVTVKKIE